MYKELCCWLCAASYELYFILIYCWRCLKNSLLYETSWHFLQAWELCFVASWHRSLSPVAMDKLITVLSATLFSLWLLEGEMFKHLNSVTCESENM